MDPEETTTEAPEATEGAAPYAEYLDRIPEDARPLVEPVFKEWDSNTTKKFQEASAYRDQWKPYEELGVRDIPVEEMQWLTQFRDAMGDPAQISAWYEQYAQANGLTPAEQAQEFAGDPDIAELVRSQIAEALNPFQQQLGGLTQWQQEQQQQTRMAAAQQTIDRQIADSTEKYGQVPRETLDTFIAPYVTSDPEHAVERAFADYSRVAGQIEKNLLAQKLGQPPAAASGGSASTGTDPIKTLDQAAAIARERIRATNAM